MINHKQDRHLLKEKDLHQMKGILIEDQRVDQDHQGDHLLDQCHQNYLQEFLMIDLQDQDRDQDL